MDPVRGHAAGGTRRQLGLIVVASVLFWTSLYVYVPVLPTHARALGASLGVVGVVVGAYGLAQFVFRIPIGIASDRSGRRRSFIVVGMLANALGAVVLALSPAAWLLVVGRAITGIGASVFVILSIYLAELMPSGQLARAAGLAVSISMLSQLVIMLVGGVVAEHFGVTLNFWIAVGLALAGALVLLLLPERVGDGPVATPLRSDLVRSALHPSVRNVALLAALLQFGNFAATYGFVPLYAAGLGASNADLGVVATVAVGAAASAALLLAWRGDRINARMAVVAGFGIAAAGTVVIPVIHNLALLTASQALSGFGRGLAFPSMLASSIRRVPSAERGTVMGVFQAIYAIGMFLGPAVSGVLADLLGLAGVFMLIAALSIVGAVAGLRVFPSARAARADPSRVM